MAAVTVTVAVLVFVVLGVVRGDGEKLEVQIPFSGDARPPAKRSADFRFPEDRRLERREETPRRYSSRMRSEEEEQRRVPRFNPGEMYFLPVRFDLNRNSYSDRRIGDGYQPLPSGPRLIMDKDFNIRFDNPYIIPLTKPLALILDSSINARQDGYSSEKMMIPFPVLVKARKPLLEQEGFRDYRDDDEVPEHRSSYDEYDSNLEDTTRKPSKKVISVKKGKKNATTTSNVNDQKPKESHKAQAEAPREQLTPEGRIVNKKNETVEQNEEDALEDSSVDISPPETYPSKIFAEMYHKLPTYPFDSIESQEFVGHTYESPPTKSYANEMTTEDAKPLQSSRVKSVKKYPSNSPMFSASTDFEWVTQANSTKAKKLPNHDKAISSRIVIHDVLERPLNATIIPFIVTAATPPQGKNINQQYWRQI